MPVTLNNYQVVNVEPKNDTNLIRINNDTSVAPQGGYTGSRYRNRIVNPLLY